MFADKQHQSISRYWYGAPISQFLQLDPNTIVGELTRNSGHALLQTQTSAWVSQIELLRLRKLAQGKAESTAGPGVSRSPGNWPHPQPAP